MARVKLDDVAADAGVSKATVSMVLNDNPLVAVATRERVRESIERTGYVYDRAAGSLRKKQSGVIGMIITTLTNPYFAEVVEGLQAELDLRGMDVLLGVSGDDRQRQERLLLSMAGRRVDGVVMVPALGTDARRLQAVDAPILLLARRMADIDVDYIGGDNERGTRAATEHLITKHGCRRLAFFGGADASSARLERMGGFLAAVRASGLEERPEWRLPCVADRRVARATATSLLAMTDFDGVVCYNDVTALGLMDAARELGLDVGRDLGVTGFDDIEGAAFATPPLTSVAVPAAEAGRIAASMLLARINGSRTTVDVRILDAQLRVRRSCGCDPGT